MQRYLHPEGFWIMSRLTCQLIHDYSSYCSVAECFFFKLQLLSKSAEILYILKKKSITTLHSCQMAGRTINIFVMNNYPTFLQQANPANNKLYEKMYDDTSH